MSVRLIEAYYAAFDARDRAWVHATLDLAALAAVRANGQVRNHRDRSLLRHLAGEIGRVPLT